MTQFKYTTDNKKVIVVGKLNSQETIVQEIFISNDSEIPSGEHFVVKSLHDAPVISWKEKELEKINSIFDKRKAEYNAELERLRMEYQRQKPLLEAKLRAIRGQINKVTAQSFDLLTKYLLGEIKYIVYDKYEPEIVEYSDFMCSYDKDKLRLVTIYGQDNGELNYAINNYSDGSGGSTKCYLFCNIEDAKIKLSELINSKPYHSIKVIETLRKYDLPVNNEKVVAYKSNYLKNLNDSNANLEKQIAQNKLSISNLDNI